MSATLTRRTVRDRPTRSFGGRGVQPRGALVPGVLFAALVAVSAPGAAAVTMTATGAVITSASAGLRARAAVIAATITMDNATLFSEGERYLDLAHAYRSATAAASAERLRIAALRRVVATDSGMIRTAAIATYVGAGSGLTIALALDGTPDLTATRTTYVDVANGDLESSVAALQNDEIGLGQSLVTERQDAATAHGALLQTADARDATLATLGAEQHQLASVNGEIATLAEAEIAANERAAAARANAVAAERAAAEAAAAEAAAAEAATTVPVTGTTGDLAGPPTPTGIVTVGADPVASGSVATAFAAIRSCESGDDYALDTGNGYYGAYQFSVSTWLGLGGSGLASQASAAAQDAAALQLYEMSGWSSWPSCAAIDGLG